MGITFRNVAIATATLMLSAAFVVLFTAQGSPLREAAIVALGFVIPCILLAWGSWWWVRRNHGRWKSASAAVLRLSFAALVFSLLWTSSFFVVVYAVRGEVPEGFLTDSAAWQFVWGLAIFFSVSWIARLSLRLRDRELAALNAELRALRSQVNPHFLFNTLHSLSQLAEDDPRATVRALETFGTLMRYVLSSGDPETRLTTLEDELAFVTRYVELETLRFGDRLLFRTDADDDALECFFPPLALQPLVENAVKHGLGPLSRSIEIVIRACVVSDRLKLQIRDDGAGSYAPSFRGVGLITVRRLIETEFDDDARMDISASPGSGFLVEIDIPACTRRPRL